MCDQEKSREVVFLETMRALMPVCGVSAIPEATKYFDLLCERVMADLESRKVGSSLRKSEDNERKEAFVKIFMELFEKKYGRKYNIEIGIKEISVISYVTESLFNEQIPIHYYLEWCFGELLDEGFFKIANISGFCSQKIFLQFLVNKKEDIDKMKSEKSKEDESVILRDMFRKCVRELRSLGEAGENIIKDLQEKGTQFKNGYLHIDDFRQYLFDLEDQIKVMKKA